MAEGKNLDHGNSKVNKVKEIVLENARELRPGVESVDIKAALQAVNNFE